MDGALGGILILWDTRVLELVELCIGCYFVSAVFRNTEDGVQLAFLGVYDPNDDSIKRFLWEELA